LIRNAQSKSNKIHLQDYSVRMQELIKENLKITGKENAAEENNVKIETDNTTEKEIKKLIEISKGFYEENVKVSNNNLSLLR